MRKYNKKHLAFLLPIGILEILMLILECLPYGIKMVFAPSPTERKELFFPYFSDMPYGYGNVFPIYVGILTIAIILLWLINLFADKRGIDVTIFVMTIVKFIFSAAELFFSRTAINWAMFALSFVLAIYCIAKAAINKEFVRTKKRQATDNETENE